MCGCDSAATARASRSNRWRATGSLVRSGGSTFEGDGAVQARISRTIDLSHAARAGGADNLVGSEPGAGRERHHLSTLSSIQMLPVA